MPLTIGGRAVQRVAVVGSGNVGPDIALFFGRTLTPRSVPVVVHDVSASAVEAGRSRFLDKLRKGTGSGVFRPGEMEAIEKNVVFTLDKSLLVGSSLVIEAATEDLEVKRAVFEELERLVPAQAVLASSSSHLEPERLFARLKRPERALVHHFFFPAERNPLVEIVAGPGTQGAVADDCARFYEACGKIPIRAKGRYGYAVNPVFEGLLLAAMLIEEKGLSPAVIDAIACRALGAVLGPFTVVNLNGGGPAVQAGLRRYHDLLMPWFRSPRSLDEKIAEGVPWRAADRGDTVSYSNMMFEEVSRLLLGAYFGLACEVLESGVASLSDLELGVEVGLALKPPFAMMNDLGPAKVRSLIEGYAKSNPGFKVPRSFGPFEIPVVHREDRDGVAVLTLRRPRSLNALNRDVVRQLGAHLAALQADPAIRGVVVAGFGVKAFASGADLGLLNSIKTPEEARRISEECSRVFRRIETLGKPVIAALNGVSVGAGSELAYACTARVARRGIATLFSHPEVRMGIIPGGGATQRLPRLIDFSTAWKLLRTGGSLSGADARALGLVAEEVAANPVDRAVELARALPPAEPRPPRVPAALPDLDLKGLSLRVDEILRAAIVEGAALPLDAALELESRFFGEAFTTRDCRIGLESCFKTGLKQPAPFTHS